MKIKELDKKLQELQEELYEDNFNVRVGEEKDYAKLKYERRKIAQIKTIIKEKGDENKGRETKGKKGKKTELKVRRKKDKLSKKKKNAKSKKAKKKKSKK